MTRVLLTGGCGFIGSHCVAHWLRNTDWHITVIDSLNYAADPERLYLDGQYDRSRVSIKWWDLRAPLPIDLGTFDFIVNMASESHVDRSIAEPVPFVLNNVSLALNTLEYARRHPLRAFIQVSTDEVYGPATEPFREWDRHIPSNPYAASKSCQEQIATAYWRTYGVPVVITATMNNFGERQHPEKMVAKTIRKLLAREPVPVHGQLDNGVWKAGSRCWLHARNHADALLFILNHIEPVKYPHADRPLKYNIAGDELSNLEIVQKIAGIMGVEANIDWVDWHSCRPGHDARYALDGSLLRAAGWQAPLDLETSLRKTVKWETTPGTPSVPVSPAASRPADSPGIPSCRNT